MPKMVEYKKFKKKLIFFSQLLKISNIVWKYAEVMNG